VPRPIGSLKTLAAGTRGAIVLGDNLPLMAALPDACIDLIYADPPFFTGAPRRGRLRDEAGEAHYDDRWGRSLGNYMPWLAERLAQMHRLLKPTGSLFVHLDYRAAHTVKVALDGLFGPKNFRNEIIWCYAVGGRPRRAFGRKHDTILFYSKSDAYVFRGEAVRIPRRGGSHMRVARDGEGRPVQEKTDPRTGKVYRYPVHAGKVPEDWWADIETLNHSDEERTGYPTQKPLRLLERIIAAASEEGAWVADFFCGSGTTAAAALALGRRALAVDDNPAAAEITRRRLPAGAAACYRLPPIVQNP
jgi:DNA modification methylase